MTTRRAFITGLLASAAAPARANPFHLTLPSLMGLTGRQSSVVENTGPFRYMVVMGMGEPRHIRWSEPQDFTAWDPA